MKKVSIFNLWDLGQAKHTVECLCQLCQAAQIAARLHGSLLSARQMIGGIVNTLISVRQFVLTAGGSPPVACSECAFY